MNFHHGFVKDVGFALLIDDAVDFELITKGFQNGLTTALYPNIYVSALAPLWSRIKLSQTCPFQNATIEPEPLEDCSKLFSLADVPGMNLSYFAGESVPVLDDMLRRQLAVQTVRVRSLSSSRLCWACLRAICPRISS